MELSVRNWKGCCRSYGAEENMEVMQKEKKRLRIRLKAASASECSGKETQRLGSGLDFYIIVKMLGNLVCTMPTHFPQASFFPTVKRRHLYLLLKVGSWTISISSIWELVRNAESGPPPRSAESESLGIGSINLFFNQCSRWLCNILVFEKYRPTPVFFKLQYSSESERLLKSRFGSIGLG